ncbi:uncharacterized protein BO80DRAFT_47253 [Aspergillus ibericus CBS 121593]|uniref:F-box domain-containing protein n=1 Tax=Aspergillus ibericus CBS 121593 TaxID=1448316 RepID=A0A395H3Y6_9EURO|nr:hypothetical protein BO80DRAFT_47253 [Aspergillus ibericus CBS 121593]RAL01925.1 hypothetical protein BO80DRAFT_47253 [Aspergillus ibericus CBS 121593]
MVPFRTILQSIFPQIQSKTTLPKIPPKIIENIFAILSIPDQICFGLSCKYIFTCLNSYLETHQKQLRQLLPPEKRVLLCPNVKRRPRIQLLLQLENNHWRYCDDCWTLHPHSTWRTVQSVRRHLQKRYCSECQLLFQRQIRCMPYAGKVDICPCVTITFCDKLQLMQLCRDARRVVPPGTRYSNNNATLPPGSNQPHEKLQHECTFAGHPLIAIHIKTEFLIVGKSRRLCVISHYTFLARHEAPSMSLQSLLPCPHKNIGNWVRRILSEGGSSFTGWDKDRSTRCFNCKQGGWTRSRNGEGPYTFKLSTLRNLGNSQWPNRAWSRNCYG